MNKQDSHFFNFFSLVLGILITVAILIFAFARHVGASTQVQQLREESLQVEAVGARTDPFGKVAIAGQDNSALKIAEAAETAGGAAPGLPVPKSAEDLYNTTCHACHGEGIGGAPKMGDHAVWAPRLAKGKDTLYKHALEGFQGQAGMMPAKGGRADLPDDLIKSGVDYMVDHSK